MYVRHQLKESTQWHRRMSSLNFQGQYMQDKKNDKSGSDKYEGKKYGSGKFAKKKKIRLKF